MAVRVLSDMPLPLQSPVTDKGGILSRAWWDYLGLLPLTLRMAVNPPSAWLTKAADFTHDSSGNWLLYPFDTANEDNDSICDTANSKLVCKTPGVYQVYATMAWEPNAAGLRRLAVYLNGDPATGTNVVADNRLSVGAVVTTRNAVFRGQVRLAVNDAIYLYCLQDSGGSLTVYSVSGAIQYTILGMKWLRP